MDDCLIHSKFADHLQDLINLFESLIKNRLKISPRKCQFFCTQIVYMGLKFLIHQGIPSFTPMKDKCDAIRHLEPPKTVRDCEQTLFLIIRTVLFKWYLSPRLRRRVTLGDRRLLLSRSKALKRTNGLERSDMVD